MAKDAQTAKGNSNEKLTRIEDEDVSFESLSLTLDKRVDLALGVALFLVGVFILIESRHIRAGLIPDPFTAYGMPYITGTFLIIAGMIIAGMRIKNWSMLPGNLIPSEGHDDEKGHPASAVRAFSVVGSTLLWTLLLNPLGTLIVTPLYLIAVLMIMGMRSKLTIIAFSLISTILLWVAFSQLLSIIMPLGPLTDIARSLRLTP